jgi:hypothetical protein
MVPAEEAEEEAKLRFSYFDCLNLLPLLLGL